MPPELIHCPSCGHNAVEVFGPLESKVDEARKVIITLCLVCGASRTISMEEVAE